MASPIQAPTREILTVCDASDSLIERYLACCGTVRSPIGQRFEAEFETSVILKLLTRHLESVCQLARHDLVLLPSAMVIARAAFEASVRAKWMLKPVDPYEREVRWVLHLRSAAEHWGKLERNSHTPPAAAQAYGQCRLSYEQFDTEICRLLNGRGYAVTTQAPNVWEMLKDLGNSQLYHFYISLSSYTHANFEAGSLYRKNLGRKREGGEFITPNDWGLPFQVTWKSLFVVACDFLYWVEADLSVFQADNLLREFEKYLRELQSA